MLASVTPRTKIVFLANPNNPTGRIVTKTEVRELLDGIPQDVPVLIDLVARPQDKRVIELLSFPQELGRPFLMPPDTPKVMVNVIRRAFEETLRDPLFLADAQRALLEVDPVSAG